MTRYKAFTLHLIGSLIVLSIIFVLIKWVWYQGPLFNLGIGHNLLLLIAVVDLVIGPVVMLIIFDAKKKYIKLDVFILLVCQLGFMAYGCWAMFEARPVYFAFADNGFHLVSANEIDDQDLNQAKLKQFQQLPVWGPLAVGTKEPTDEKIKSEIALGALMGMGVQNLPQYFVPYSDVKQQVKHASKSVQQLNVDQSTKQRAEVYLAQHKTKQVLFLPVYNKRALLIAVIDAHSGDFIQAI